METGTPDNNNTKGFTVWITGLPYSGKKKTAEMLSERLKQLGYRTELLVGGEIRRAFEKELGFTRKEIEKNIQRIAFECKMLSENGIVAIAVTISPYKKLRQRVREEIDRFIEVYQKCPLDVLKKRDTKKLYQRAEENELKNVAGVSIPYEESENPEVVINDEEESAFIASNKIIMRLQELGFLEEEEHSVLLKQEEKDIRRILRENWLN